MLKAKPGLRRSAALVACVAILGTVSLVFAQRLWSGPGRFGGGPPKWAARANFDGSFNYCRGFYSSSRPEAGGMGSWTDYPGADNVVVRLTDPLLSRCHTLFMEDVGTARFHGPGGGAPARVSGKGRVPVSRRFLGHAGPGAMDAGDRTRAAADRVSDLRQPDHPIMHTLYDVKEIPQVSSINFWRRSGGSTSE